MQLLCLYEQGDGSKVHCRVQSDSNSSLAQQQWSLRFTATCTSAKTADVLLQFLEWRFAQQLDGPGLINAPYSDVREELLAFVKRLEPDRAEHPQSVRVLPSTKRFPHGHGLALRLLAGLVALLLFMTSIGLQVLVCFYYPIIIALRRNRSPLYTAAESAYIFTVLDWSTSVRAVVRIALGQRRLWPAAQPPST